MLTAHGETQWAAGGGGSRDGTEPTQPWARFSSVLRMLSWFSWSKVVTAVPHFLHDLTPLCSTSCDLHMYIVLGGTAPTVPFFVALLWCASLQVQ